MIYELSISCDPNGPKRLSIPFESADVLQYPAELPPVVYSSRQLFPEMHRIYQNHVQGITFYTEHDYSVMKALLRIHGNVVMYFKESSQLQFIYAIYKSPSVDHLHAVNPSTLLSHLLAAPHRSKSYRGISADEYLVHPLMTPVPENPLYSEHHCYAASIYTILVSCKRLMDDCREKKFVTNLDADSTEHIRRSVMSAYRVCNPKYLMRDTDGGRNVMEDIKGHWILDGQRYSWKSGSSTMQEIVRPPLEDHEYYLSELHDAKVIDLNNSEGEYLSEFMNRIREIFGRYITIIDVDKPKEMVVHTDNCDHMMFRGALARSPGHVVALVPSYGGQMLCYDTAPHEDIILDRMVYVIYEHSS